jgi:hypothetical protein
MADRIPLPTDRPDRRPPNGNPSRFSTKLTRCSVCLHADINDINKDLAASTASCRNLAEKYHLNYAALYRHRREHLPQMIARAAARAIARQDEEVLHVALEERANRLKAQQDRHDRLKRVMEARGAGMVDVPGGETGLLVRRVKSIGYGDSAQVVEEYELDATLLAEARKLEEQAAREVGQLGPEAGRGPAGGPGTIIVVVPMALPPGAKPITGPVTMDIPGRLGSPAPDVIDVEPEPEPEPTVADLF